MKGKAEISDSIIFWVDRGNKLFWQNLLLILFVFFWWTVPWNLSGNYDKQQRETAGCCELQRTVQWMIFLSYRTHGQELNIFQGLEGRYHNLGVWNREVHWRWSSTSPYLQILGNRWRHNARSLLCLSNWMVYICKHSVLYALNATWYISLINLHYLSTQPSSVFVFKHLRQIPMIESYARLDSWWKNNRSFNKSLLLADTNSKWCFTNQTFFQ